MNSQNSTTPELHIAEIPYENGTLRYRYSRYMSADGTRWIRHGLFHAYHANGNVASEGSYTDGAEQGLWRDYHENGQIAAQGHYQNGAEAGEWEYWNDDGLRTS
ncbi:toxin-antitoxin system YwqK family antitoxin [Undibacterium sp. Di27W]|uniref:toxin-antitoxin system YwqK family antitoxin n=1 Tax=Undibacterium sp. Di27W TaxID=3413036 RepID=UPI003BEF4E35